MPAWSVAGLNNIAAELPDGPVHVPPGSAAVNNVLRSMVELVLHRVRPASGPACGMAFSMTVTVALASLHGALPAIGQVYAPGPSTIGL